MQIISPRISQPINENVQYWFYAKTITVPKTSTVPVPALICLLGLAFDQLPWYLCQDQIAKYDPGFLVDLISGSNDDNDSREGNVFFCVQTYSLRKQEISHPSGEAPLTGAAMNIFAFKPVSDQLDCL